MCLLDGSDIIINSQLEPINQLLHSLNSGLGCDLLTIRSGFATWSSLQFHSFVDKNGALRLSSFHSFSCKTQEKAETPEVEVRRRSVKYESLIFACGTKSQTN